MSSSEQDHDVDGQNSSFSSVGSTFKSCDNDDNEVSDKRHALGILSDGTRFTVPKTLDVLSVICKPLSLKSIFVQLFILSIVITLWTYDLMLKGVISRNVLLLQFIFWRFAYNVGIGWLLYIQSTRQGFVKGYESVMKKNTILVKILESAVVFGDDTKYRVNEFPDEYNAWMSFRFIVMVVLGNDLVSYIVMVFAFMHYPNFYNPVDIILYIVGFIFIVFAITTKVAAHRIIGDYAWYWGDFFFLLDRYLVFDGVFQMFPHPMYSAGYGFMYGLSIMAKSSTVFYVSLFAHMSQLMFLTFVENPHIQKTYYTVLEASDDDKQRDKILYDDVNGYFYRDELIVLKNFDVSRSSDLIHLVLIAYAVTLGVLFDGPIYVYIIHYILWRSFFTIGLGYILREQSRRNWWVMKFKTSQRAFENWKQIYNVAVVMTNVSYLVCAYKMFEWDSSVFGYGNTRVLSVVIGLILVSIHLYVTTSVYEAIGDFGYFYGDFFIGSVPSKLIYSGIYRFMNNPDSLFGFSGYYGVCLISGNIMLLPIAVMSHVAGMLFEIFVENPHMRTKYNNMRNKGGFLSEVIMKSEASKAALRQKKNDCELIFQKLKKRT